MVERGGRKRDGWRDGRGWYRAGGKEETKGRRGTLGDSSCC